MVFFAGQAPSAADFNSAIPNGENQTVILVGAVTSTSNPSFSPTLGTVSPCSLAYVCPPSGAIAVTITASGKNSSASQYACISMDLSGAAGVANIYDNYQSFNQASTAGGAPESTLFREFEFTGLTPGAAGLVTMVYRAFGGGTATFNYRQIKIRPIGL